MEAGPGADYDVQGFKVPSTIPQDLLLIQDLISPIIAPAKPVTPLVADDSNDSVASSGESIDSADEAEAILVPTRENPGRFASHFNNAFLQLTVRQGRRLQLFLGVVLVRIVLFFGLGE
jgi:hypothetical protein